eukprot:1186258-Prorocentrum_minimum.AAC.1
MFHGSSLCQHRWERTQHPRDPPNRVPANRCAADRYLGYGEGRARVPSRWRRRGTNRTQRGYILERRTCGSGYNPEPIGHSKHRYILTTDQSDTVSAGIFYSRASAVALARRSFACERLRVGAGVSGALQEWVKTRLNFDVRFETSVFETVIRIVGGFISAYDLSVSTL